MGVLLKQEL